MMTARPPRGTPGARRGDNRCMAEPTPQDIQRFIADGLPCEHVEVEGDGRHFFATIVSAGSASSRPRPKIAGAARAEVSIAVGRGPNARSSNARAGARS